MTNISVPSIATAAPIGVDTVLGIKSGVLQRFSVSDINSLVSTGSGGGSSPGKFYPTPGGGAAAVQAAITAATTAGGGTVELGNATWVMASGITFDPTIISLVGDSATMDFSTAGDVNFISLTEGNSGLYKGNFRQRIQGIRITGAGQSAGTALNFYTPSGGDFSSSLIVEQLVIESCKIGVNFLDNAYVIRFYNMSIRNASIALNRSSSVNNGECLAFFGCSFFNGGQSFKFLGPNFDAYFYSCSFDFNQKIGYTDALVELHGCHLESATTVLTGRQFETDNGGTIKFFGGNIGLCSGSGGTPPDFLFYAYPSNGGGYFHITDVSIETNQWTTAMVGGGPKQRLFDNSTIRTADTLTANSVLTIPSLKAITPVNSATATVQTLPNAAEAFATYPYGVVILAQSGVGAPSFAPAGSDILHATAGVAASVQYGVIAARIISPTEWALAVR
jgi:hypothetical protein